MDNIIDKRSQYINILNRIQKRFSSYEGLLLIKKQYFTDNIFYYFLCLLFRFIHLISFSIGFNNIISGFSRSSRFNLSIPISQYLKMITCHNLAKQFGISFQTYKYSIFIILIFLIFRVLSFYNILKHLHKHNENQTKDYIIPNKYQIIMDHIIFLLFPYIIEYLSFIYYIYYFPSLFVISVESSNAMLIFVLIIINTILIIEYNLENYINFVCVNRIYTIIIYDAYINVKEKKENYIKPIAYKSSNIIIFIYIILQNFVIFLPMENYINYTFITYFKIVVGIIILLIILILFLIKMNSFNYLNIINSLTAVIFLFCFYSIIFDFIIFRTRYRFSNKLNEIIYILIKLVFSYITFYLFLMKSHFFLESKIIEIIFQEKNNKKENDFINSFYYLHQIMLKIKGENNIESAFLLIKFLNKHINKCNKLSCNCKLFNNFISKEEDKKYNEEEIKNYIYQLLIILNYLFESSFIDYDYYKSYDLVILLAEHFCHMKNNPTMAFSLISTFIIKQNNKFNKFQLIVLYELSQKYIYYISAIILNNLEEGVKKNNIELLLNQEKIDKFREYYINLKRSYKVKKLISNYIDNEMKILKYKYIFEDSLSYQFDESNENIISVKINFYNEKSKIDNLYSNDKNKIKSKNDKTNLYNVIYLLKKEQLFYYQIINSINEIDKMKGIPIFMIFKYFLFFDLFEGGKMPIEMGNKLYNSLTNESTLFNGIIKWNEYKILKRRYNEEYNRINSKIYSIYELKREIRTKYFNEEGALKLGYNQKDIIDEKIDILMPKIFYKSHQNAVKQLLISDQLKYFYSQKSYFFDKTTTILYPASFEASLIYNLSKNLLVIGESIFIFENNYTFMLDNNFELLSISTNFEDEYYLNQKLLQAYNIRILDILKINPEKLYTHLEKELKIIQNQKYIRQARTEEYFIPQFYAPSRDKTAEIMNSNHFNNFKGNFISKIAKINNTDEDLEKTNNSFEDNEEEHFIKKDNVKNFLSGLLIKKTEAIIQKTFNRKINKGIFIENIAKELTKIPDNDLMLENDKASYNLITSAKNLIANLSTKNALANDIIDISIKFAFFYDRPFYFISIDDEKKTFLNITKNIHFQNYQKNQNLVMPSKTSSSINSKKNIPHNKKDKKSQNKILLNNNNSVKNKNLFKKIELNENKNDYKKILEKINKNRKAINKDKFITIIRWILSIIIFFILVLYICIIFYQKFIINISKQILMAYYYGIHIRDVTLYSHSKLLQIYYDYYGLSINTIITEQDYKNVLDELNILLKESYFLFLEQFYDYNTAIGHDYNLLLKNRKFSKLRGFWEEIHYESSFLSEFEFLIYNLFSLDIKNIKTNEGIQDLNNFIFFRDRKNTRERINTSFIKVFYYLCVNYEFGYKDIFQEIEDEIHLSYNEYIAIQMKLYIFFEILGLILYIIFYVAINFYLYNSNEIIIKNIIFLFLDFSEENNKSKNNYNNNIINLKLIEFKSLIDDFDLSRFEKYSQNLDNINKNKYIFANNNIFTTNNDYNDNKMEQNYEILNQSGRTSTNTNKVNSFRKKNTNEKLLNQIINTNHNKNELFNSRNKGKGINNSSHNYLVDSNSNSQFFKDKLNSNSINASNSFLENSNSNSINNKSEQNKNKVIIKKEENEENMQDLLLNRSNKTFVLIIKYCIIAMLLIIILIFGLITYKIQYTIQFNNNFNRFFSDFTVINNRYSFIYYFFNTLRTLIIFPEDNRKKQLEFVLRLVDVYYTDQNQKFINILSSNKNTYKEIIKFFSILMESKNNSTEIIKDKICSDKPSCLNYLDTKQNIFDSGVDFAHKTCINNIKNIYLDYTKLNNKKDINLINSTIINSEGSEFSLIGLSLSNVFLYIKEITYDYFAIDVRNFNQQNSYKMNMLNIISIIFALLTFFYVIIFMFISIWRFTQPIKEASYRINCSFYYIKKYSLTAYRKIESII